ncbi:MAG: PAS domain-containing protein, partial [Comamonas sp.]
MNAARAEISQEIHTPAKLMSQLLDGLQEGAWLLDAQQLTVVYANAASQTLTGYGSQEVLGRSVLLLAATPLQHAFWSDPLNWSEGAQFVSEICRADGMLVPVEMRVTALDSQPCYLLLSMVDKSAHERHETVLGELLAEMRATLESAADGILVCGPDGDIRAFNHRFSQLWTLPQAILSSRDDAAVFAHLDAQILRSASQFTLLQDTPGLGLPDLSAPETSEVLDLCDGRVIERRSVPQVSRGVPTGRIFSYRDITAQSQAAADLRLAARVFESSLDGIFIADAACKLVQVNPAGRKLLEGLEVVGRDAGTLFATDEGAVPELSQLAQEQWEQGAFWEGNLWLTQAHDQRCAVWLSWVALRDGYGNVVQSIGFMRDMTQQRFAQQRI